MLSRRQIMLIVYLFILSIVQQLDDYINKNTLALKCFGHLKCLQTNVRSFLRTNYLAATPPPHNYF